MGGGGGGGIKVTYRWYRGFLGCFIHKTNSDSIIMSGEMSKTVWRQRGRRTKPTTGWLTSPPPPKIIKSSLTSKGDVYI